ncbi:hypothetical protein BJ085DRAFT_35883 [Dimargaris cristalligena]|uniref:Uncharacterized protein n=1 Tax=Dimargaris cristalligena TaxID=215637 RepID=A0A4P9ZKZ5_9FUNG|nr:hypothetical protein BJ085DRAFT_35883 [Dimargaris cristalligena]|eukprot:RKP33141.1 hypothetical protein BJ085DRAFT_35883 [Dimargaris cristalligena]
MVLNSQGQTYQSDKLLTLKAWLQATYLNPQLDMAFFWSGWFYKWEAQANSNHPALALVYTSKNTESSAPKGGSNTGVVAWEGLGEAYFHDGWYNTAQWALQCTLELVEPKAEPNLPSPLAVSIHWLLGWVFQNSTL